MSRIGRWLGRFFAEWGPVVIAVLLIRSFVVEAFMVPTGSMEDTILVGDCFLVNKFVYGVKLPFTNNTVVRVSRPRRGDIVVFRTPAEPDAPPAERYARIFPGWLPLFPVFWDRAAHFFKWYIPTNLIKRCVAVAGDTVECRNKQLYINGRLQVEPYASHQDYRVLPGLQAAGAKLDFQQAWVERRFFRTELSVYIRDEFGPVVVPDGHIMVMGDNRDNSEDARFFGPLPLRYVKGRPLVTYFSTSAAGNPPNIPKIVLSPWAIRLDRIGHIVR